MTTNTRDALVAEIDKLKAEYDLNKRTGLALIETDYELAAICLRHCHTIDDRHVWLKRLLAEHDLYGKDIIIAKLETELEQSRAHVLVEGDYQFMVSEGYVVKMDRLELKAEVSGGTTIQCKLSASTASMTNVLSAIASHVLTHGTKKVDHYFDASSAKKAPSELAKQSGSCGGRTAAKSPNQPFSQI